MSPRLAGYIAARLRTPAPDAPVVPGSTPILSFGDPTKARVATLGLNPSRLEFLDRDGGELTGESRRLETLRSLGVRDLASAPERALIRVVAACNEYFQRNPYRRWFDQLEPMLQSVGASYYDGSACHLDLVQWATDPAWAKIRGRRTRDVLLEQDSEYLREQLSVGRFRLVLINGSGVRRHFESLTGIELRPARSVSGRSTKALMSVGGLPCGTRVLAWSLNVQSSFGVSESLRVGIADAVGALARGAPSGCG